MVGQEAQGVGDLHLALDLRLAMLAAALAGAAVGPDGGHAVELLHLAEGDLHRRLGRGDVLDGLVDGVHVGHDGVDPFVRPHRLELGLRQREVLRLELHDLAADPAYADVRDRLLKRVRENWDPARNRRESTEATEAFRLLSAWGKQVNPPSEDGLAYPPPSVEEDVELL